MGFLSSLEPRSSVRFSPSFFSMPMMFGDSVDQRESKIVFALEPTCRRQLSGGVVEADGVATESRDPCRNVRRPATVLEHIPPVEVGEEADLCLRDSPETPRRFSGPVSFAGRRVPFGLRVPGGAIRSNVVGRRLGQGVPPPSHRRKHSTCSSVMAASRALPSVRTWR
jgi:hypothetical protein